MKSVRTRILLLEIKIGEQKVQLLVLKIKVNVDLVGLSPLLDPLKESIKLKELSDLLHLLNKN
jgi:hypothetical protein